MKELEVEIVQIRRWRRLLVAAARGPEDRHAHRCAAHRAAPNPRLRKPFKTTQPRPCAALSVKADRFFNSRCVLESPIKFGLWHAHSVPLHRAVSARQLGSPAARAALTWIASGGASTEVGYSTCPLRCGRARSHLPQNLMGRRCRRPGPRGSVSGAGSSPQHCRAIVASQ